MPIEEASFIVKILAFAAGSRDDLRAAIDMGFHQGLFPAGENVTRLDGSNDSHRMARTGRYAVAAGQDDSRQPTATS